MVGVGRCLVEPPLCETGRHWMRAGQGRISCFDDEWICICSSWEILYAVCCHYCKDGTEICRTSALCLCPLAPTSLPLPPT